MVLRFGPNVEVTAGWGVDETDPLAVAAAALPSPPEQSKLWLWGGNIFAFLPLATQPVVNLGSTNNYFTLYSWVFVKSLHTLLRDYTTWE